MVNQPTYQPYSHLFSLILLLNPLLVLVFFVCILGEPESVAAATALGAQYHSRVSASVSCSGSWPPASVSHATSVSSGAVCSTNSKLIMQQPKFKRHIGLLGESQSTEDTESGSSEPTLIKDSGIDTGLSSSNQTIYEDHAKVEQCRSIQEWLERH